MLKEITIVHQDNGAVFHPKPYYYADDERGEIWSEKTHRWLKGGKTRGDYLQVCLQCDEGTHPFQVHRLIWETFNGPIPIGLQVNHINENKVDNRLANLNLMTPKDNSNHGTHNARVAAALTNHPNKSKQVFQYDLDGTLVNIHPSTQEAQRQGFKQSAVSQCCRNCFHREGNNVYKNFIWSYVPLN